jgi:hypothetical protein
MAWGVAHRFLAWAGLFLPFSAFAGGLRVHGTQTVRATALAATGIGAAAIFLLGYASPIADFKANLSRGLDVQALYPEGPRTLNGLARLRSAIRRHPPDTYSLSTDQPLAFPPNWLAYLIHSTLAFGLFSILSALLGWQVGFLTSGLSPPVRKNTRWAAGLVSGAVFFLATSVAGDWIRSDPLASGMAGAWIPVLVPACGAILLGMLLRRRRSPLHVVPPRPV